jgi:hypothetical protein
LSIWRRRQRCATGFEFPALICAESSLVVLPTIYACEMGKKRFGADSTKIAAAVQKVRLVMQ